MTTAQIIIFIVLFIADFYYSMWGAIYRNKGVEILVNMVRMAIIWTLLITLTMVINSMREKESNKQKVESPKYQLVTDSLYRKIQ